MNVRDLKPNHLWNNFEDLNAVPRPSKKEERVIEFMMNFGKSLNLHTVKDSCGNVVIKKPGMNGGEGKPTIVLQSHLDMVHQKNADTVFDFNSQGIESYIDGDWVTAKGTTLGADNGMGVATMMSLLQSSEINHPPIEALFTIDEETGMTGAFELDPSMISGRILLNLDTEEDDELSVGCAGGIDINANWTYNQEVSSFTNEYVLNVNGLKGGHSGMEIHIGRGNANKIAVRILSELNKNGNEIQMASFDGGSLRNAIPREAVVSFVSKNDISEEFAHTARNIMSELEHTEKELQISLDKKENGKKFLSKDDTNTFITVFNSVFNGMYRMSDTMKGQTETSSNLARLLVGDGEGKAQFLTRSSIESAKMYLASMIKDGLAALQGKVEFSGSYPGWTPNLDSPLLELFVNKYEELNGEKPHVLAGHGGLECGILGEHFNGEMDMISFGPTIVNPHSPDESVNIASVEKFWNYLIEILKSM